MWEVCALLAASFHGRVFITACIYGHSYLCGCLFVCVYRMPDDMLCVSLSMCRAMSVGVSSLPVFNQPFNQTARSNSRTSRRKLSDFTGWSLRVILPVLSHITGMWIEKVDCTLFPVKIINATVAVNSVLASLCNQQPHFTCIHLCKLMIQMHIM